MEPSILKKRLSSFVTDKGYLKNVNDETYFELLKAWENWTGSSKEFYRTLGFSSRQLAGLIGKAKKMQREGHFGDSEFKEVRLEAAEGIEVYPTIGMEVMWKNGQVIRFSQVDTLIDFLKKAS
jgi:hypothetical protein